MTSTYLVTLAVETRPSTARSMIPPMELPVSALLLLHQRAGETGATAPQAHRAMAMEMVVVVLPRILGSLLGGPTPGRGLQNARLARLGTLYLVMVI